MKTINIIIDDENRYFSAGLRLSIADYAQQQNKVVQFLSLGSGERPDLVLASSARRIRHWSAYSGAHIVTIKERRGVAAVQAGKVLYRTDGQLRLFKLLSDVWAQARPACGYVSPALTQRERQVMSYLRRGLDQSQTARIMGVSVKTVHSHKRSVMNKMMLIRQHDFIYWLLSQEQEHS